MKKILLGLAVGVQMAFLIVMYVNSLFPVKYGVEIKVRTQPIDPRSMFRGNYVNLFYDFSMLPNKNNFKKGSVIYAMLKKDAEGIYILDKFADKKPNSGVFVRGRVESYPLRAKYGLEAYFMPKDKALALEKSGELNDAIVTLGVLTSGRAGIKNIEVMDRNLTDETIDISNDLNRSF